MGDHDRGPPSQQLLTFARPAPRWPRRASSWARPGSRSGASRRSARARARRWRWPPERVEPSSPEHRVVALGQLEDEGLGLGALGRLLRSASVASPSAPNAMLSADAWSGTGSAPAASASPARRSDARVTVRRSWPSMVTRPCWGSKKRSTRLARVLLPAPVRPTSATVSPGAMRRRPSFSTGRAVVVGEGDVLEPDLARHRRQRPRRRGRPGCRAATSSTAKTRSRPARDDDISARFWLMLRIGLVQVPEVGEEDGEVADGEACPAITLQRAQPDEARPCPRPARESTTRMNRVSVL